jgi:hypothetical protein
MRRALAMAAITAALIAGTATGASAAPLGPVSQSNTVETGSDLLVQAGYGYRGRSYGYGYRSRGPSFGFYLGAPAYYSYSRCWWSHRYNRRVCTY